MWDIIIKISAVAGIVGLIASLAAWDQARGAKRAAEKAGNVVTLQKTAYDIMEIMRICEISEIISDSEINNKYGNINGRIMSIVGLLEEKSDLVDKNIIDSVQNNLTAIYQELTTPVDSENAKIPHYAYNRFIPLFNQLIGSLGKLKGKIDGKLLINNK